MKVTYDIRSFLIVFSVLLGNAAILDIDLFLAIISPVMLILWQGSQKTVIPTNMLVGLSAFIALLALLQLRTFGLKFPYSELYWYWPIKSIVLLLFFVSLPHLSWPPGNQLALGLFCLLLIASANIEDGRTVSIFGPNMLYRFFGAFYLIAVFQLASTIGTARKTQYICIALSALAIIATGSSGGLIVLIFPLVFLLTPTRFLTLSAAVIMIYVIGSQEQVSEINAIARLTSKLQAIEDSPRVVGIIALLSQPFSFFGRAYQDFTYVWVFGYQYPHNMLVELYIYFGVTGLAVSFLLLTGVALGFARNAVLFGLMSVFIGAMLSGDLSENFGPIAIYLGYLLRRTV